MVLSARADLSHKKGSSRRSQLLDPLMRLSFVMEIPIGAILLISFVLFGQEFEVASVKAANPNDPIDMVASQGGRLTITNFKLTQLIEKAYGVEDFQISGGPVWISQDRYSIIATPPDSSQSRKFSPVKRRDPPPQEELLMLQALLADRFHLKLHLETREGTVYGLVVSSKGPKLRPAKNPDDRPMVGSGFNGDHDSSTVTYYISGQNVSMPFLAAKLAVFVHRPVTDKTGLRGSFDFKLDYAEGNDDVFLFAALQKELGLKLESKKGPIEILVIDHAEKPSAN